MKAIPFGVNTEKFKPTDKINSEVLIYYKSRDPKELIYLKDFLKLKK